MSPDPTTGSLGPFQPESFRPAYEAAVEVEWNPGTRVSLSYTSGSLLDRIPAIGMTGLVPAAIAFYILTELEQYGMRWAIAPFILLGGIVIRTMIEKEKSAARQVVFDWGKASASFGTQGNERVVPFADLKELVLQGKSMRFGRTRAQGPGKTTTHYWCELIAKTASGDELVAQTAQIVDDSKTPYEMLAPMAQDLARAIPIPWRWTDFESQNSILDSI